MNTFGLGERIYAFDLKLLQALKSILSGKVLYAIKISNELSAIDVKNLYAAVKFTKNN